jgi:hypothetical protein
MTQEKIVQLKEKALCEAERYYDNAKMMLSEKAGKKGDYYSDAKYVKTACGTAYSGVLLILDAYIKIKGRVTNYKERKSIEYYRDNITDRDNKLLKYVNSAYNVLHLSGYYDGELKYKIIQGGMEVFQDIIKYFRTRC